jgi:MFS family permease
MSVTSSVHAAWGRYRALLALPGARAPLLLATAGSMPIGMFGLAILLLARDTTGSFAAAGRIVAAFSVANALGSVLQGRLMDRFGQGRVLRVVAAGHLPALVLLVTAAHASAPGPVLAACAACGGATLPQLPSAMRSLWSALAESPAQRQTAYAMVSITFEVAVVTAPAIVGLVVSVASPGVAVVGAAALGSLSAFAFAGTAASRRWSDSRGAIRTEVHWLGALSAPGMRAVVTVLAVFGTSVGVVQVAVPAFAADRGSAATGGVLLAALSLGSLVGGIVYGGRGWPGAPVVRLAVVLAGLGTAFALLALPGDVTGLGIVLVLGGLLLAPATVICSTLLDTVAPGGTVTEAFALTVMAIVAGTALGNALGGALVEAASYDTAVLTAALVAAGGAAVALLRRRSLGLTG